MTVIESTLGIVLGTTAILFLSIGIALGYWLCLKIER